MAAGDVSVLLQELSRYGYRSCVGMATGAVSVWLQELWLYGYRSCGCMATGAVELLHEFSLNTFEKEQQE